MSLFLSGLYSFGEVLFCFLKRWSKKETCNKFYSLNRDAENVEEIL